MNCTKCGQPIEAGERFCGVCGTQVISSPNQTILNRGLYPSPKAPKNTIMGLPTLWVIVGGVALIVFFLFIALGLFMFMGARSGGTNPVTDLNALSASASDNTVPAVLTEEVLIGKWVMKSCSYKTADGQTGTDMSMPITMEFRRDGKYLIFCDFSQQSGGPTSLWECGSWTFPEAVVTLSDNIAPCNCEEARNAAFNDIMKGTGDRRMAEDAARRACDPTTNELLGLDLDFSLNGNLLVVAAKADKMARELVGWTEITRTFEKVASDTASTESPASQQPATTSEDLGTLLAKGDGFMKAKQYTQAKVCFQKAYEMNPSPSDAMLKYALCCSATGDIPKSHQLLDLYLSSNPVDEGAYVIKTANYLEQNDPANAKLFIEKLEEGFPNNKQLSTFKNKCNQLRPGSFPNRGSSNSQEKSTLDISINPGGTKKGVAYVFIDGQQVKEIPIKKGLLEKFVWNGSFQLQPGFHTVRVQLETEFLGVKTVKEQQFEFKSGQTERLTVKLDKASKELLFNWD